MPEGDTLWRTAEALRSRLVGQTVTDVRPPSLKKLTGRELHAVESRGKHLFMRFQGQLVLHTHMRMTGAWHLYRAGERWRRVAHRATALLDFGEEQAVLFAAPVCELMPETAVAPPIGPDILQRSFDLDEVMRRARAASQLTVAELLLDQAICAGIGNIYRCESLWQQRVDPFAPVCTLDEEVLRRVYHTARDLMARNAVGDAFRHMPVVHGRAHQPCPRCGTLISLQSHGRSARILYWCSRCQQRRADAD